MFLLALLPLHLALLVAAQQDRVITIKKCCGEMEVLSGDGQSCVEADWPRNTLIRHDEHGRVVPPLDTKWMQHWLPSGLPLESVLHVDHPNMFDRNFYRNAVSVNESSVWSPARRPDTDLWRKQVVFFGDGEIARPKPGGGFRRTSSYCVDAALQPLGPFALLFSPLCTTQECAQKCCVDGQVLERDGTYWWCVDDSRVSQLPRNTSFSAALDPEFPYVYGMHCARPLMVARHLRTVQLSRAPEHHFTFATWRTCADHVRNVDGALEEAVWYCEYPRLVRGVYRLLRPLCVASVAVLVAALLTVVCDCRMRRKVYGWCLACHAGCLLGFNLGQVVYYVTISDIIDDNYEHGVSPELEYVCRHFALSMYFLLTAAWFWLSALCINMALGFRLQVPYSSGIPWKKLLAWSSLCWGLPALLTITSACLQIDRGLYYPKETAKWYNPSHMETRVCYTEFLAESLSGVSGNILNYSSVKHDTALFFYGPVSFLVLINMVCLVVTLRRVQYLRRGNSLLRREQDNGALRHSGDNSASKELGAIGDGKKCEGRSGKSAVDVKTMKLFIKISLMRGLIELLSEVVSWSLTNFSDESRYDVYDYDLPYRATGYVMDFFRAVIVAWLAAPEGGYLRPVLRSLRRDNTEKSTRKGIANRRKQNVT